MLLSCLGQFFGGRPVWEKPHAGKYGEMTPLLQRAGAGDYLSLLPYLYLLTGVFIFLPITFVVVFFQVPL